MSKDTRWIIGTVLLAILAGYGMMWTMLNNMEARLNARIDSVEDSLSTRLDSIEARLLSIEEHLRVMPPKH